MTEPTREVTFTYDEENGNILQNVKAGDKIHFRAMGNITDTKSIVYKKTMILRKEQMQKSYKNDDTSPHIKHKISQDIDIILNSNEQSGISPEHIYNFKIDYYLTVIKKDGGQLDFSDNIIFTGVIINNKYLFARDTYLKGISESELQPLKMDDILKLIDYNELISKLTNKKIQNPLTPEPTVNIVHVWKENPNNDSEKKKPVSYLRKSDAPESYASKPLTEAELEEKENREKRADKIKERKKQLVSYQIQHVKEGGKNRTIKKR